MSPNSGETSAGTGGAEPRIFWRLLGQARPCWAPILGIFLLDLLAIPLTLLTPLPLKITVDSVLGSHPISGLLRALLPARADSGTPLLLVAAALVVVIALLSQAQALASSLLRTYTAERLVLDFRTRLFRHATRLSLAYHDSKGTADSTYRIQNDAASVQYLTLDGFLPLVTAAITLASMLYVTARVDGQLAVVALAISPPLFWITWIYRPLLRSHSREIKRIESSTLAVVQEVLAASRVVKAFAQEEREESRFVSHSGAGLRARLRLAFAEAGLGLTVSLVTGLGTAIVLLIGARHVQAGTLTLGNLLLVMAYLAQLYAPLKLMSRKASSLQSHLASAERAFALLDEAPDVVERPDARPIDRASGAVTFRNVSFAYGEDRPILRDVSLEIKPGTRVGIIGATGAGKTTFVNLLVRFYDPAAGEILLDGVDLRDYRLNDLRNQFGMVLQEPVLLSASIAENIGYARPGASMEEIVEAARAAEADGFISALPSGYETQVGERGMRLSGGERQRISLARAFLKNAPLLILDEPTSSVDVQTEAAIMETMERLCAGRTTFMITHRLSTVQGCDVLLTLHDGHLTRVPAPAAAAAGVLSGRNA